MHKKNGHILIHICIKNGHICKYAYILKYLVYDPTYTLTRMKTNQETHVHTYENINMQTHAYIQPSSLHIHTPTHAHTHARVQEPTNIHTFTHVPSSAKL